MARLPQPGSDDGTWGGILNEYLSQAHNADGTLKDNVVTADVLKNQSVVTNVLADGSVTAAKLDAGLTATINGKTDLATVAASYLPIKNGISPVTDSTNDFFTHINITDDGTATANWPDRFAFYFNGTRSGYHNEYGEIRARPAKTSTVALRAMGHISGPTSSDIFQVASGSLSPLYFTVSASASTLSVPLTSTSTITAPNLVTKSETWANTTDPVGRTVHLNYTLNSANPDTQTTYTPRGDGQANFRASWLNEWGALRGTSPYQGYGDALVRAIRTDQDIIGTGVTATNSNAVELVDRRTGANNNVMWGRSWVDGHLTRNGNAMADSIVLNTGDPVPAGLPAGTIIVRI